MTDHRDEVEQLLADYRRSREQLATVQRGLLSISESAASPDGLVVATVDSTGTLSALRIADDAYGRYRPAELADAVLRASRAAAVKAGERANQALAPALPADTDPAALLAGRADLSDDEIAPVDAEPAPVPVGQPAPARTRVHDDGEDSFEETTWMNAPGRGRSA